MGKGDFINKFLNFDDGLVDFYFVWLKVWGYNFFRYVFIWESFEYVGFKEYDYVYMDYIIVVF